jgi:hypothetical protein
VEIAVAGQQVPEVLPALAIKRDDLAVEDWLLNRQLLRTQ